MDDIKVPIYLVTGFLESGKTTFLDFTLQQDYFSIDGKTLLILCEEGEEEYDMDKLKLTNTVVEVIEDEEDLTPQRLAAMDIIHQPERVVIEYNGMWLVSKFEQMELPEGWGIEQEITCVDATTYQVYMANMKSLFMDMIRNTDMVIFNRCKKEDPLPTRLPTRVQKLSLRMKRARWMTFSRMKCHLILMHRSSNCRRKTMESGLWMPWIIRISMPEKLSALKAVS